MKAFVRFVILFAVLVGVSVPVPTNAVDYHQNGWTNLNWIVPAEGRMNEIVQEITPLRVDYPSNYVGWAFHNFINFCWQKKSGFGPGTTCGYFGVGLWSNGNTQSITGNFDLAYNDAKAFKITNTSNPVNCERRDPSKNVLGTNYIVCWTGISLTKDSTYRFRLFSNDSLGENWWTASFQDLATGKTLILGNIQGEGNDVSQPMSFISNNVNYGGPVSKCETVPISDYLVGNLRFNGQKLNYSGVNSGSCTKSAINLSSNSTSGYFLRTGGSDPSSRHYTTAGGTSNYVATPTSTPTPTQSGQPVQSVSCSREGQIRTFAGTTCPVGWESNSNSDITNKKKPATPKFSLVNFSGNKMNVTVNLGDDSSSRPDSVYLVSPKLGIASSNRLAGKIVGSIANWTIEFDKSLSGALIPMEITAEKSGVKSDSLNGSYALPGAKCPEVLDKLSKESQPQVKGFIFTGTNQKFVRVDSKSQVPVTGPTNLVGCYVEPKFLFKESPDWQIGTISRDEKGYFWTNGAGVSWRLTLVDDGRRLVTDRANPYFTTGNTFELDLSELSAVKSIPSKPVNFKTRIVGDLAIISVESEEKKKGGLIREVFLVGNSLGVTEKRPIKGSIAGTRALIEVPLKPSMMGKKFPISIYFANEKGKSRPLNATLVIPSPNNGTSLRVPAPSPPIMPKTVICARPNQTRAFEGETCPPGWEKM